MKKNLGNILALYPAPVTIVGAMVDGKPNWTLVAHTGTMCHSHVMLSMVKSHLTNQGIRENRIVSVNLVDASWLREADYMGCVSGHQVDKSHAFSYSIGENGAPLVDQAKVSIECQVDGTYVLENFENFFCRIEAVYADESILNEQGKISYDLFKPVLFEFPTYQYYLTGEKVGDCRKMGNPISPAEK
ncbi:flavin reductase family protein [Acidaminococcus fermentans]|uniref:flavin reductase family protein n=1 Tax=Acidaminococcus fermentans TaxID=905 RepID=UPI0024318CA2|nr:flavin reductase family protein [Acidaminococcus fermentans]